jgi:hypothetical protein
MRMEIGRAEALTMASIVAVCQSDIKKRKDREETKRDRRMRERERRREGVTMSLMHPSVRIRSTV